MSAQPQIVETVIVGAGLAGLSAARVLAAEGRAVVVVEARGRVGGRTANHQLPGGDVVEVGGQFAGPTQNHILRLAADVGVETFRTFDAGAAVYVKDGRSKRFTGDVPPDLLALPSVAFAMHRINRLAAQVPLDAPWRAKHARAWDAVTFETWLRRTSVGGGSLDLVNVFLGSAYGRTAADASLLFSLWYIAGMGDESHPGTIERGISVADGAQELRFHGGSHAVSEHLAAELGDQVVLEVTRHHGRARVGETFEECNRALGPLTTRSTWTVREIAPMHRRVDAGTGFAGVHELLNIFEFRATEIDGREATEMSFTVRYRPGLGLFGRLLDRLQRAELRKSFKRSMQSLEDLIVAEGP